MHVTHHSQIHARPRGFSLVELSVVLVVIGLIIGAVTIGRDVQRTATNQKIASEFVQGWLVAYDSYFTNTGLVPGDTAATPTGRVNASGTALCNVTPPANLPLSAIMQAAGIAMPEGRSNGREDRAVYLDSNGNPQEVQVCFQSVAWSDPAATVGNYTARNHNVMTLTGLTPSLATQLDNYFDSRVDARFGKFRLSTLANNTTNTSAVWGDDRSTYGTTGTQANDEDQVAVVTAYLLTSQ